MQTPVCGQRYPYADVLRQVAEEIDRPRIGVRPKARTRRATAALQCRRLGALRLDVGP